eukprot:9054472-Lingulodinium_polyedra.AAC.1
MQRATPRSWRTPRARGLRHWWARGQAAPARPRPGNAAHVQGRDLPRPGLWWAPGVAAPGPAL